jgi:single-strand selective monofunctional uracil DNA glycosylase
LVIAEPGATMSSPLISISRALSARLAPLEFAPPVSVVYDPCMYARRLHERYLDAFASGAPKEAIFLGMNPGPWGMAQTGVPFGDVGFVRDWMGLNEAVDKPELEHPKRPIDGLMCGRREVSGSRLWGWASERFASPEAFFERFFVWNYCPLSFMEEGGRNRTPDKLPADERHSLFAACDEALAAVVDALSPSMVIGVGAFAEKRASRALSGHDVRIGRILHPSPASPKANRGWAPVVEAELEALGVRLS